MAPVLDEFGREIPDALMYDNHNDDRDPTLSADGDKDVHMGMGGSEHLSGSPGIGPDGTNTGTGTASGTPGRYGTGAGTGAGTGTGTGAISNPNASARSNRYSRSRSRSRSRSHSRSRDFVRERGGGRSRSRSRSRGRGRGRTRSRSDSRGSDRDRDRRRSRSDRDGSRGGHGHGYDWDRDRDRDMNANAKRRVRGRSRSRSRSPISRRDRFSHSRPRSRSYSPTEFRRGSGNSGGGVGQSRYRGSNNNRGRSYSQSHSRPRDRDRDRHRPFHSERKARKSHPSMLYAEDQLLLCQYLWEKEKDQEYDVQGSGDGDGNGDGDAQKKDNNVDSLDSTNDAALMVKDEANIVSENEDPNADPDPNKRDEDKVGVDGDGDGNGDGDGDGNAVKKEPLKSQATLDEEYKDYNKTYCLKYVRSFFNQHLDDTWFRERYSPLEYRRFVQQNRERAAFEAACILNEVDKSCQEHMGGGPSTGAGASVGADSSGVKPAPSFVVHARLGGGMRSNMNDQARDRDGHIHGHGHGHGAQASRKRKYSTSSDTPHFDAAEASGLPKSHLLSFLQENTAMQIMDIPSHVSDEHLSLALKENAGGDASLCPVQIISSSVVPGVCSAVSATRNYASSDSDAGAGQVQGNSSSLDSKSNDSYQRNAWAIFESEAAKDKLIENLIGAYLESESGRHARDSRFVPKVIELSVECSDPYGRYDIDADGKGGAPVPKAGSADEVVGIDSIGDAGAQAPRIPIRRVSVFVSSSSPLESQTSTVLSAAVSSLTRIEDDKQAAITIARKLDEMKDIPQEARLESVLRKLFDSEIQYSNPSEDMLDVAIAYLRRVHIFTFYNGCTSAMTAADCLAGNHPTSVIHLRLKGADEILQKAKEEHADMYDDLPIGDGKSDEAAKDGVMEETKPDEPKDMLVMRLDDSIAKALAHLPSDIDIGSPFIVNETVDAVASEIESLEVKAKKEWIDSHAMVDGDGRARCSFHFCRKLFKDESFLKKHLMKKHGEYLTAEMAKSHDSYMMKWWDQEICRPVPQILVDCGSKLGLISEAVIGDAEPCVVDPEPELWREEQEKIRQVEEEEQRYREQRAAAAEVTERNRRHSEGGDGDIGGGGGGEKNFGHSNFVDVDDMKDEKVQLSFIDVDVAPPPKKKKRKKKKLL